MNMEEYGNIGLGPFFSSFSPSEIENLNLYKYFKRKLNNISILFINMPVKLRYTICYLSTEGNVNININFNFQWQYE